MGDSWQGLGGVGAGSWIVHLAFHTSSGQIPVEPSQLEISTGMTLSLSELFIEVLNN